MASKSHRGDAMAADSLRGRYWYERQPTRTVDASLDLPSLSPEELNYWQQKRLKRHNFEEDKDIESAVKEVWDE